MQLTKLDAAILKRLQTYHSTPPRLRERLLLVRGWMALLLLICAALAVLLARLEIPGLSFVPIGIYLGAIGREIGGQRLFVKRWPLNREITDWARVEQLLHQEPIPITPAQPSQSRKKWAIVVGLSAFAIIFGLFVVTDQTLAYVYNPTRKNPADNVIVLSASWCPYCAKLRRHLIASDIPYTELDVDHTTEGNWGFYAVRGTGIPITIIGSEVIRGTKWEKIDAALKKAGYKPAPVAGQLESTRPDAESSRLH
jgi:glutaredoxin